MTVVIFHSQETFIQDLFAHFIKVAVYFTYNNKNETKLKENVQMIIYQSESCNGIIPQAREDFLQHFIVKRQEGDLAVPLAKCLCLQEAC